MYYDFIILPNFGWRSFLCKPCKKRSKAYADCKYACAFSSMRNKEFENKKFLVMKTDEKNEIMRDQKSSTLEAFGGGRDGLGQNPTQNLTRPEAFLTNPTRATFSRTRCCATVYLVVMYNTPNTFQARRLTFLLERQLSLYTGG